MRDVIMCRTAILSDGSMGKKVVNTYPWSSYRNESSAAERTRLSSGSDNGSFDSDDGPSLLAAPSAMMMFIDVEVELRLDKE
jgi:hypothetical protein